MHNENSLEFVFASLEKNANIFYSKLIFMNHDFDKNKNHNILVKLPQYSNTFLEHLQLILKIFQFIYPELRCQTLFIIKLIYTDDFN